MLGKLNLKSCIYIADFAAPTSFMLICAAYGTFKVACGGEPDVRPITLLAQMPCSKVHGPVNSDYSIPLLKISHLDFPRRARCKIRVDFLHTKRRKTDVNDWRVF